MSTFDPLWKRLLLGLRSAPAYANGGHVMLAATDRANRPVPSPPRPDNTAPWSDPLRSELLIEATTTIAGLHRWPGAPKHRAYLRHSHRHLFEVSATVEVDHGDRATEFHDLGEWLDRELRLLGAEYPGTRLLDFGARSCEQLAQTLAAELARQGFIPVMVAVSEDGEHTGIWRAL